MARHTTSALATTLALLLIAVLLPTTPTHAQTTTTFDETRTVEEIEAEAAKAERAATIPQKELTYRGHAMMLWVACANMHSEACGPPAGPCLRARECAEVACHARIAGSCLTHRDFHLCRGIQCDALLRQRASYLGRFSTRLSSSASDQALE